MVDEHPHGKIALVVHLDLDVVRIHCSTPLLSRTSKSLSNVPGPIGIRSDLLQFLVQRLVGLVQSMSAWALGKEQFQKSLKEEVEGFFPGTIIIGNKRLLRWGWNGKGRNYTDKLGRHEIATSGSVCTRQHPIAPQPNIRRSQV